MNQDDLVSGIVVICVLALQQGTYQFIQPGHDPVLDLYFSMSPLTFCQRIPVSHHSTGKHSAIITCLACSLYGVLSHCFRRIGPLANSVVVNLANSTLYILILRQEENLGSYWHCRQLATIIKKLPRLAINKVEVWKSQASGVKPCPIESWHPMRQK